MVESISEKRQHEMQHCHIHSDAFRCCQRTKLELHHESYEIMCNLEGDKDEVTGKVDTYVGYDSFG